MPRHLAAVVMLLLATACADPTPPPAAAPATTSAAPTTIVVTCADVCAREGGTQGYSAATGVRVCEHDDVILFRRDPANPMGFKQRCTEAGGKVQGTTGTRPCMRAGDSWFTPDGRDDPATERYALEETP